MADLLNGRYELGEQLGAGGMGRVLRARDTRLDRDVAIKILRGEQVSDDTARARLKAEARIAGGLFHPGVAQVFDYDEDVDSPERDPFIVMQHIEGTPLSDLVRERGRLDPETVEAIVGGVAEALQAAHERGIVHRDLKPSNILVTPRGTPVVVDFGIAVGPDREPLTATGSILGTAEYLSPEQARGASATPASDVYALGLVAYTCLTGTSAFRRDNHVASALAQLNDALPPFDPSVPAGLQRLVASMTAKDPADRPDAAAVAHGLGGRSPVPLPPLGPATVALVPVTEAVGPATAAMDPVTAPVDEATRSFPAAPVAAATSVLPTGPAPAPERRRRRGGMVLAGVGGLAAVVLAAFLLVDRGPAEVQVPDVVGDTSTAAGRELDQAGLDVRRTTVDDPRAEAGVVVSQTPEEGTTSAEGDTVTIRVASGQVEVSAADLLGQTAQSVRAALERLGLTVAVRQATSTATAGTVTALDRSGRLPVGSTVTITVAVAPVVQQAPAQEPDEGKGKKDDPKDQNGPGGGGPGDKKP